MRERERERGDKVQQLEVYVNNSLGKGKSIARNFNLTLLLSQKCTKWPKNERKRINEMLMVRWAKMR